MRKVFGKKAYCRIIATILVLTIAFLLPATPLREYGVEAASKKVLYIKEVKLFVKEDGTQKDAKNWCDAQTENKDEDETNDWKVADGNLNEGAEGKLKSAVGVFFCYQTTTDYKEAIRDMAVMNEQGNYSEGSYQMILDKQQEIYVDMVADMKDMIEEYRTNVNAGVPTALNARDFLNGYKEDDSGELLGNLLMTISDSDLAKVLLQANGQVVIAIQEQLSLACDTTGRTWLDRMQQVESYAKLKKQFVTAYNGSTTKAKKAMDVKFHDKALILAECWDDVHQHFDSMNAFIKKYKLGELSKEDATTWLETQLDKNENEETDFAGDLNVYIQEKEIMEYLMMYSYDGATLLNFFEQDYEEISGDNLYKLYPLASCLSDGQMASINESVSLYQLITNSAMETVLNGYDKGLSAEIAADLDSSEQSKIEEITDAAQEAMDEWGNMEPISVYEGVERGIYGGGVAVTSLAENYSEGKGDNWTDSFVESGMFSKTAIGLAAGSVMSAALSIGCAVAAKYFGKRVVQDVFNNIGNMAPSYFVGNTYKAISYDVSAYCGTRSYDIFMKQLAGGKGVSGPTQRLAMQSRDELFEKGLAQGAKFSTTYKVFQGLKIGFAVLCILLAVADIIMTSIALFEYYNRDHIPIPKYIVDLTYDENKETSYIAYKNVTDQNGGEGDLNGGGGKQWLGLFVSRDEDAGDPIMAPDGSLYEIKILKGSSGSTTPSGLSPLHLFGYPNSAQNLTFSDGENGWSFNDKLGGTYMYFERNPNYTVPDMDEDTDAGTIRSASNIILVGGIGMIVGIIAGVAGSICLRRVRSKRKKDEK